MTMRQNLRRTIWSGMSGAVGRGYLHVNAFNEEDAVWY